MGTSRSSTGPRSGVPIVPSWVDDPPPVEPHPRTPETDSTDDSQSDEPRASSPSSEPSTTAPSGRFRSTRSALGKFASSGDKAALRQGVGRYVRNGLGGAGVATRRFASTGRTAQALYRSLGGGASEGKQPALDAKLTGSKSAREAIAVVVELACPVNGTQDAEASRQSINDALSDLLKRFPDADLLQLSEAERGFVIERFIGLDVFRRFVLDVGRAIQSRAASATVAIARLKEAKEFIRETVAASFKKLRDNGQRLSGAKITQTVQRALRDALDVFSGYAE